MRACMHVRRVGGWEGGVGGAGWGGGMSASRRRTHDPPGGEEGEMEEGGEEGERGGGGEGEIDPGAIPPAGGASRVRVCHVNIVILHCVV